MPIAHLMLALMVVVIWGLNFLAVKLALQEMTPLWICAIRFFLASLPVIAFIKPPAMPFRMVMLYGLIMFVMQFSFLFMGMHAGMPAGMASIIMQVQVFFSVLFAAVILKEIPRWSQIFGALISFSGLAIVGMHFDKNVSLMGFILILAAAASWGIANLITKKYSKVNMIALVIWGSFVASWPMLVFAFVFEGLDVLVLDYHQVTGVGISSLLYITYASTWVGYGVWNWLLSRYPVGTVVPFTLLVPIVGVLSSVVFLGEPLQTWKWVAGLLVLAGLGINLLSARLFLPKLQNDVVVSER